jgi:hypothetical protein
VPLKNLKIIAVREMDALHGGRQLQLVVFADATVMQREFLCLS